MGLSEGAEEILAAAADPYFAPARDPDRIFKRLGCGSVYLYLVLKY